MGIAAVVVRADACVGVCKYIIFVPRQASLATGRVDRAAVAGAITLEAADMRSDWWRHHRSQFNSHCQEFSSLECQEFAR